VGQDGRRRGTLESRRVTLYLYFCLLGQTSSDSRGDNGNMVNLISEFGTCGVALEEGNGNKRNIEGSWGRKF